MQKPAKVALLVSVVSFIFGLLLQPALGHMLSTHLSDPLRVFLGLLVLLVLSLLVAAHALLFFHFDNAKKFREISRMANSLSDRFGLTVEFITEHHSSGQDAYTIVRTLIQQAEREILILDHRPTLAKDRFFYRTPPGSSRRKYYREMTQKALGKDDSGNYFRYKRIVQLEEGPTDTWDCTVNQDPVFANHVKSIVDFRQGTPKAVSAIKTSRVFFPKSSLVIVDRKMVLMELAISGPEGDVRIEGDLLFNDPNARFAGPLAQLFDHIETQSTLLTKVAGL